MKIKVGDKVRIADNVPEMYTQTVFSVHIPMDMEVEKVQDGSAHITPILSGAGGLSFEYVIPTKYLTKVEDEAKEPKFNVGDKVVVHYSTGDKMGRIQEVLYDGCYDIDYGGGCTGHHIIESRFYPYTEPPAPTIKVGDVVRCKSPLRLKNSTDDDFIGTVTDAENGWFIVHMNNGAVFQTCNAVDLELVQPTEQAEEVARIRQLEAELDEFRKAELDRVLHPEKYHTYAVTIDNVAVDWQRYEADLAKEVAVKLSKPNENKPDYVAEYAVSVAKAVVENLKKK